MLEMCDLLLTHVADRMQLAKDPVVQAAAQRWIKVLGEAARYFSDDLWDSNTEIPWPKIVGT